MIIIQEWMPFKLSPKQKGTATLISLGHYFEGKEYGPHFMPSKMTEHMWRFQNLYLLGSAVLIISLVKFNVFFEHDSWS